MKRLSSHGELQTTTLGIQQQRPTIPSATGILRRFRYNVLPEHDTVTAAAGHLARARRRRQLQAPAAAGEPAERKLPTEVQGAAQRALRRHDAVAVPGGAGIAVALLGEQRVRLGRHRRPADPLLTGCDSTTGRARAAAEAAAGAAAAAVGAAATTAAATTAEAADCPGVRSLLVSARVDRLAAVDPIHAIIREA